MAAQAVAELDADPKAARAQLEESVALVQQAGDRWGLAFAFNQLSSLAQDEGDEQAARRLREESASLAQLIGDRITLGIALAGHAHLARLAGEYAAAERLFKEALSISAELGPFWRVTARALDGLASTASLAGNYVRSARLFGAAAALWEASGKRDAVRWRAIVDADAAKVRVALGAGPFAAGWAEGHALRMDEVLACALEPNPASDTSGGS